MSEESATQTTTTPDAEDRAPQYAPGPAPQPRPAPADAPADAPDTGGPEDGQDAGGINLQAGGPVNANNLFLAHNISVEEHYEAIVAAGGESFAVRAFSAKHCDPVSREREDELQEVFVAEEGVADGLLRRLLEGRLVILTGEPEVGKRALALHLSRRVRDADCDCQETFLVSPPQRQVRLELQKVAEDGKSFGRRVVVFSQVGETENRDILDTLARLKGHVQLDKLRAALAASGSYFVFTADAPHLKALRDDLQRLDLVHEVRAPPAELLGRGLDKKVAQFLAGKNLPREKAEAARALVAANREVLLRSLPKMSRLARFVESYLLDSLEGKLDLAAAVELVESPEKWFTQDLSRDFDAWCFVFTLGLCQCGDENAGVPWLEFEAIRREISRHLSRSLRVYRRPPEEQPPFARVVDETRLLEECRAVVVREAGVGDYVRFADAGYAEKLWPVFTNSNRSLLTSLLPLLHELTRHEETPIRARAARILGRVGEINPAHIMLSAVDRWAPSRSLKQRAAVGYLLEGAFASCDESYRQLGRAKLESLSQSERGAELWAAIAAYKQLGRGGGDALAQAVQRLGEITERNFSEWMVWKKRIDRLEHQLKAFVEKQGKDPHKLLAAKRGVKALADLRRALRRAYDEDDQIMLAICYSLVALSLHVGTFTVIAELNKWLQQGRKNLSELTSWIFWMEEGIADSLSRYNVPVPATATVRAGAHDCYALVVSLDSAARDDPQAVAHAAHFLAETYGQFGGFPTHTRQFLRKKFLLHLKRWADRAWVVKEYREVLADLCAELRHGRDAELSANLTDYLKNDPDFTGKAHLKRFAEMVLQRRRDAPRRPGALRPS